MSDKVAILSDVHGNSPALRAVLQDIHSQGCDKVFVLGDIINGVDPRGCLELLHTYRAKCIKGNAEHYVLTPDLGTFPRREKPLYVKLIPLFQWWRARLSEPDLAWLRRLPDLVWWNRSCLAHDSPLDRIFPERWHVTGIDSKYQELCYHAKGITQHMPEVNLQALLTFMDSRALSHVFCGHTHTPFCWQIVDKLICNVGSVGMPLDGDPRPSWAMVEETDKEGIVVTIRRVQYDIGQILHMVDHTPGFPSVADPAKREAYKKMLTTGIHWKAHYHPRGETRK